GWLLRSPSRIPGIFPISPKWRLVLFGLGTIQFARHPEGLVENGKRKFYDRVAKKPPAEPDPEPAVEAAVS
ncbi:MAG: hypothetical protein QOE63_275, partial [Acidimicrobiaceae bacterium]